MSWRMQSTWSAASRRHEQKHGALQFQFVCSENQPIEATVQQERLVSTGKFKDTARRLPAWGIGIQQWACCLFEHRQRRCFTSWTYLEILHHLCTGCPSRMSSETPSPWRGCSAQSLDFWWFGLDFWVNSGVEHDVEQLWPWRPGTWIHPAIWERY